MHLKGVVRVELYQLGDSHIGSSVHVCYSPSDSVLSIKQKLQLLTGIPALSQTLSHATTQLSDSDTLHSLSISRNAIPTLHMHVPIRGGATGFAIEDALDIQEKDAAYFMASLKLDEKPEFGLIYSGVNLLVKCANNACQLGGTNSDVIIPKGNYPDQLGYCSVRSELLKQNCPCCGDKILTKYFECFVFDKCTVEIDWRLKDENENKKKIQAEGDRYVVMRLTSFNIPFEYIDFRIQLIPV